MDKTDQLLYESEIEDKRKEIERIKNIVRQIYAIAGEDKEVNRLCNLVLE